jgi:hypothetical protein
MRALLGLFVVLAGCSGRDDVVITGIDLHSTPDGLVELPADMSNLLVQIYAGDERLPAVPVQGDASGTIVVKGVPDGPFVIAAETEGGGRWWWASESHDVAWHWRYAGRLDARRAEVQQPITLAVGGLDPWTASDSLTAFSLDTSTEMASTVVPEPAVAGVSIAATFEWNASDASSSNVAGRPYLMDAGDHFTLARKHDTFDAFASVSTMTQVLDIDAPMQEAGAPLTISGTMTTLAPSASSRFTIDHPALASAMATPPTSSSWTIDVYQTPAWAGRWGLGASVLSLSGGNSSGGEVASQIEDYPLPFDPAWETWVAAMYQTGARGQTTAISMTRLDTAGFVLGPRALFAPDALLDGQSIALETVAWDGTSPIELSVPGAEDGFTASVYRLDEQPTRTERLFVGSLISDASDIRVPAGVFEPGERYELSITIGAEDANGYAYSSSTLGPFAFSSR